MPEVHVARRAQLRERCAAMLAKDGPPDAVLVTRPANIRYLTGCPPQGSVLLLGPDGVDTLLSPATAELPHLSGGNAGGGPGGSEDELRTGRLDNPDGDAAVAAADLAVTSGARLLAVEEHHLTVARHRAMASVAGSLRFTALTSSVEAQRVVKDDEEISALRVAAEITDQALGELLESILVGRTERHLALELERRLIDHGAEGSAFPTSVATGRNAGLARHRPTDRRVEEGDFLSVRLGAQYHGYRCQIGRTFVIGTAPEDWQVELYDLVFAAQRAGREALTPGRACSDVDRATRQVLRGAGHADALGPATGFGVGLEIGEDPRLSPGAMSKLDDRVPVTIEPGVHLPGQGGVRIDDTLVVRPAADGGPELLTITTKELLAL
jgi:Xaa-Pro aminopeptidase